MGRPALVPDRRRLTVALAAVTFGVLVAGFWNYPAVDEFGRQTFAEPIVGDTGTLAGAFGAEGAAFGVLFAVAAGLAATFTACNCVVFAMMPGLATSEQGAVDLAGLGRLLAVFTAGVVGVGVFYGAFVGMLGPEGIAVLNEDAVRLAQARAVFSALGLGLLVWGAAELGFLDPLRERLAPETLAFLARPVTKAGLMGVFVGLFAVGRPFPVFRDFLTYAATSGSPLYGAATMVVHGLGMILVMVVSLVALVWLFGDRIGRWAAENPARPALLSGGAMLAGGAYFVFYWGLALAYDVGNWGFKLGLYG